MNRIALALLLVPILVTGCVAPLSVVNQQTERITGLEEDLALVRAELAVARDSLQFLDDIDSGRYYRDRLRLTDRISQLEFQLAVMADGGRTVGEFLADDLFRPASADLTDGGKALLDTFGQRIREEASGRKYRVEGHSDNVPVGPSLRERFPSNWELSAARASAVASYLIERHNIPADRFEIVGMADTRPLANNNTDQGRRQNRRVRVASMPAFEATTSR
jgi:chemotaxis protein MotB